MLGINCLAMTKHTFSGVVNATRTFARLLREERGTTSIEYGLMAALMAVAAIQAMSSFGGTTSETLTTIDGAMVQEDIGPPPPPSPDGP